MSDPTPSATLDTIEELDRRAFAAWPAEEVVAVDGWRLRAMRGVTQRANSVFTGGEVSDLGRAISIVEREYERRGLPPLFQISPASKPRDLDARLEARGYVVRSPVSIQTAPLSDVFGGESLAEGIEVNVAPRPSDDWFEIQIARGRFARTPEPFRGLVSRLGAGAGFALARIRGRPVGAALCVAEGEWLGIFAMLSVPEARRQGVGSALVRSIADWGRARGVKSAYLQVERDNVAANDLYARAGFRELYGYHYRIGRTI